MIDWLSMRFGCPQRPEYFEPSFLPYHHYHQNPLLQTNYGWLATTFSLIIMCCTDVGRSKGTKRAAESDSPEASGMKTRGSKAAKTEKPKSTGKKASGGKRGPKVRVSCSFIFRRDLSLLLGACCFCIQGESYALACQPHPYATFYPG